MKTAFITTIILLLFTVYSLEGQVEFYPDLGILVGSDGVTELQPPNALRLRNAPNNEIFDIAVDAEGRLTFYQNAEGVIDFFMDDDRLAFSIGDSDSERMELINSQDYAHPANADAQVMGDGGTSFIIASREGDTESAGIHGDGDALTLWSPGDEAAGSGLFGHLFVLDEDNWNDGNTNPYDGGALVAYLNTSGVWTVSDRNRKSNIKKFSNGTDAIKRMNAYTYYYTLNDKEIQKSQEPIQAVGLMAQEIEKIIPQAVSKTTSGNYFVNYNMITPVLVEALKEQQVLIEKLQQRIDALEAR